MDGRADQYALACLAYQLLTGVAPFERDQGMAVLLAHLSSPPPSLGSRQPGLPGAADRVLAKAMAKNPEDRYGSCREFADTLREALGLAPYISVGAASAPDHLRPEIPAPQPSFSRSAVTGTGATGFPADQSAAATIDPAPVSGSTGTIDVPEAAVIMSDPARPVTGPGTVAPGVTGVPEKGILGAAATANVASQPTGKPGTDGESGRASEESGQTPAHPEPPTRMADVLAADQPTGPGPGSGGDGVQPPQHGTGRRPGTETSWIRRHRVPAIGLADAVLTAAVIIPFALTSSPGSSAPSNAARSSGSPSLSSSPRATSSTTPSSPSSIQAGAPVELTSGDGTQITTVAFSPSGNTLAGGAIGGGTTYLWDTASAKLTATFPDPSSRGVRQVVFSPSGKTLAAADNNGTTYLWDITTSSVTATFPDPDGKNALTAAFGPSGTTLATGDYNGNAYLWDVATEKVTATFPSPDGGQVWSVAFSPSGTTLATVVNTGTIYLWNIATQKVTAILKDPSTRGAAVAFSPDGTVLAAADGNGRTYLWDVATQKVTATFPDPTSSGANSVAFSPNGTQLVAADGNNKTYLWNIPAGKLIGTFPDPDNQGLLYSVAFCPSGTALAVADGNNRVYLWNIG